MELALNVLLQAAQREIHHNNDGLCPDELEGYVTRDPDCLVCQAISTVQDEYRLLVTEVDRLRAENERIKEHGRFRRYYQWVRNHQARMQAAAPSAGDK